jgi:hypothetical protein
MIKNAPAADYVNHANQGNNAVELIDYITSEEILKPHRSQSDAQLKGEDEGKNDVQDL